MDYYECTIGIIIYNPADGSYTFPAETGLGFHDSGEKMGTFTAAADELELRFQLPQIPAGADSVYCWLDNIYLEEVVAYVAEGGTGNGGGYRYGFNGQEKSTEINGSENFYTAEFWQYDSRLGRRWNVDIRPKHGVSSYSCFRNNPLFFKDPLGDTTYRWNDKGKYLGMGNLDVNGIQGAIGRMQTFKTTENEEFQVFMGDKYFRFNDEGIDREQLNEMKIGDLTLTILKDENINWVMNKSFIKERWFLSRWDFAMVESRGGGRMDFNGEYTLPARGMTVGADGDVIKFDKMGGFWIAENGYKAYNTNDMGQFLWGQAMRKLGFGYATAKNGAHIFTISTSATFDTEADQSAIRQGFHYKVKTTNSGPGVFEGLPLPDGKFSRRPRRR